MPKTLAIGVAVRFEIGELEGIGLPKPYKMDAPSIAVHYREL
jgi:hypothetical protein